MDDATESFYVSRHVSDFFPESLELHDERLHETGVVADDNVLLVAHHGLHGPVERAAEELGAVDHHELVVHEAAGEGLGADEGALLAEAAGLAARHVHRGVVQDEAHAHSAGDAGQHHVRKLNAGKYDICHLFTCYV